MYRRLGPALLLASAAFGLGALPLGGVGCTKEPITGRNVPLGGLIPESEVNAMGIQAFQEIVSKAPLVTDPAVVESVERVGRRIARVVDKRMAKKGRALYEWEFKVIDEPTVNAFALPGGKVAFYRGILPVCGDENGIAVVMGHEIAHAYAQHGRIRLSHSVVAQFGLAAVRAALGGDDEGDEAREIKQLALAALGVGTQLATLAFSRADEAAADHIGLILMAEAGYDPRAAVAFWERMQALSKGQSPPEFLSTHPSHETRIAEIKKHLPEALAVYERAKAAGG